MKFLSDEHRAYYIDFHAIPPEQADEAWANKVAFHTSKHELHELIMDIAPWDAYESPVTGSCITSKRQRNEDLKRSNSRPWEGLQAEQQEAARHKMYQEQKQDQALDKAAWQAYYAMSPEKRRKLRQG